MPRLNQDFDGDRADVANIDIACHRAASWGPKRAVVADCVAISRHGRKVLHEVVGRQVRPTDFRRLDGAFDLPVRQERQPIGIAHRQKNNLRDSSLFRRLKKRVDPLAAIGK